MTGKWVGNNNNDRDCMEQPYTRPYSKTTNRHLSDVIDQINMESFKQLSKKLNDMEQPGDNK